MTNLLDPKLDYIFKNIFGIEKNKYILISFLNALLKGNPYITDLHYDNTDISKILEEDKASRLDVKATTDNGTKIDIEIQCKNTGEIPHRAFHYLSNMISSTVKSGESYKDYNVIGIWILGENITNRINAISESYMTFQENDKDPYQILTDKARIIFIELQRFNPKNADMKDLLTGWLSFLKDPVYIDKSFLEVTEVRNAMDTLKYISTDDEVRSIADLRQRTINDKNSELSVAKNEGIEIGEKRGIRKGKKEGKKEGITIKARETAMAMLKDGISIETINKYTGLSIKEIKSLVKG
jgi:predicted transposase/invertase (TIGR01784 family)